MNKGMGRREKLGGSPEIRKIFFQVDKLNQVQAVINPAPFLASVNQLCILQDLEMEG
jgi:hypothetical protein